MREADVVHAQRSTESSTRVLVPLGGLDDEMLLFGAALPATARLVGFRGVERLSTPYRFEVAFTTDAGETIDMRATLGTRIALGYRTAEGPTPHHHGVIASLELLEVVERRAIYLAVMVPELWHLRHSVHSRIYTDVSLPDIIRATLTHAGLSSFELQLSGDYEVLEHVCQYRESDLAFVSRLMERDGLYYFFEHGAEAEKLVIADDRRAHRPSTSEAVRFTPWSGVDGHRSGRGISRFRCRVSAMPAMVRLSDYDPQHPSLPMRGEASISQGRGDVVLYGENLRSPADGARLARVRAEELMTQQDVFEGTGDRRDLYSGYEFDLDEHPRVDFNRRYLVTELHHYARAVDGVTPVEELLDLPDDSYRCELHAIDAQRQFRAPRVTPWPRIDGVTDGVVDASGDSAYAPVDEHGRYRVRMFFDESDLVDGSGSAWVRMLQPHGGGVEGMHFPLRKGTEVHMVFLGGDPDRPVIVGTAPNAHKPSKVTQGNPSQNVLRSGSSNQLVMEDAGGGEYVGVSTPHLGSFLHMGAGADNFVTSTGGNGREHVGGNRVGTIGGSFDETVTGAVTQAFQASMDQQVTGPVTQAFAATLSQAIAGPVTQSYAATQALDVGGDATHSYGANLQATVGGTLAQQVTGAATFGFASSVDATIGGAYSFTVDAVTSEAFNGAKSTTIAGGHTVSASGAQMIEGFGGQTLHGTSQAIESDGMQVLRSADHVVETGSATTQAGTITLEAGGSASVSAAEVGIAAGTVGIDGGDVAVSGGGSVTVTGGAIAISGGIVEISAGVIKLN